MKLAHQFIGGKRRPLLPHLVPQGTNEIHTHNPNIIPTNTVHHIQSHASLKWPDILPRTSLGDDARVDY